MLLAMTKHGHSAFFSSICAPVLTGLVALAVLLAPPAVGTAQAQSTEDKATAAALFDQARKYVLKGDFEKACPKLAESQRLDPAIGTQLNLAACYLQTGRTASAWIHFQEVAAKAGKAGDTARAEAAAGEAKKLEAKLTKISIDVEDPVEGIEVRRGDAVVKKVLWGTPIPVDPDEYLITASAPGKKSWKKLVTAVGTGVIEVTIPKLKNKRKKRKYVEPVFSPKADDKDEPDKADEPSGPMSGVAIAGIIIGSAGLIGAAAGIGMLPAAKSKTADADALCNADHSECTPEGVVIHAEAINLQSTGIALLTIGSAAALTGLIMILAAPSGEPEGEDKKKDDAWKVTPLLGPGFAGGAVFVTF